MRARLQALQGRPFLVALLVALAAQLLLSVHLDRPSRIQFDETHYVPAVRALLALEGPRNIEHPLVGKELIATGITIFGDNPIGWRALPTVAGTASVVAIFALLWLMLGSMRHALGGAAFAALNQMLYIQARIAMLDVFLGAFLLWAMVLLLWAARGSPGQAWARWIGGAVLLGLAVGTKWSAIPYVALAGLAFVVLRLRDASVAKKPLIAALSGKDQPHWRGIPTLSGLVVLGTVSIATYLLSFLPAFFYTFAPLTSFWGLIDLQFEMYAMQTQVLPPHTYQSDWWSWPLMLRPIWYFYEWDAGAQRGVLLVGNPVVLWGGLAAVLACYWAWVRERALRPLAVALLWTASLAIYVVIPKSLGFFYYYHLSALFLCLVLPVALHHFDRGKGRGWDEWTLGAAAVAFIYFYPILSAAPLQSTHGFQRWTWFYSWR
jgi:dolichyl-phosphate-mannose-protein mannosyltransferase